MGMQLAQPLCLGDAVSEEGAQPQPPCRQGSGARRGVVRVHLAALALPCIALVTTSSTLEMKESARVMGCGSGFCRAAHFSGRFSVTLSTGDCSQGQQQLCLGFDFCLGVVTLKDRLLSRPPPPQLPYALCSAQ